MAITTLKSFQSTLYHNQLSMKFKMLDSFKVLHNIYVDNPKRGMAGKKRRKDTVLTLCSMNPQIVKMQFAVQGGVLLKAMKHQEEMNKGMDKPFKELIFTNLSDAHAMGQSPITFLRQVLAVCVYPALCNYSTLPADVKKRAQIILNECLNQSMGSYTDSQGLLVIREHIAEYISKRDDGIPSDPNNIFIMDGASPIIKLILSLFSKEMHSKPTGILVPIPSYPIYTAIMTELKLHPVYYYLDEDKNWGLDMEEIKKALENAKCDCEPRAIVVINPGNPTGQVLSKRAIEDLIKFAHKENLAILADEEYQENIFDEESDFHSFKKVKHELGPPFDQIELASFLSISKGYTGECGLRGGCAELDCFDKDVHAMTVKAASVALCSNTVGQTALSVITKPPEPGDASHEEFMREKCCILNGLSAKAKLVKCKIDKIKGLKMNTIQGALYAMVKIDMPQKAIREAKVRNLEPDVMWCYDLLDSTGIVVVPGSGFGQKPGTHHFRTTILPPFEVMERMARGLNKFQKSFMKKFA